MLGELVAPGGTAVAVPEELGPSRARHRLGWALLPSEAAEMLS